MGIGRDARPEIPPWRRRATAADFWPQAAAAERRRIEREQRRAAPQATLAPEPEAEPKSQSEPDEELGEPTAAVRQQVRHAVRQLRGK
jgi:hypothetical protein